MEVDAELQDGTTQLECPAEQLPIVVELLGDALNAWCCVVSGLEQSLSHCHYVVDVDVRVLRGLMLLQRNGRKSHHGAVSEFLMFTVHLFRLGNVIAYHAVCVDKALEVVFDPFHHLHVFALHN